MANSINRFYTLNKMQKSVHNFHSTAWELKASFNKRSRCVSFIRKDHDGYTVTRTGITYSNFMAALASLIEFYIMDIWNLVRSEAPLKHTAAEISESVKLYLSDAASWDLNLGLDLSPVDMSVPRLPTYDRGPKKEFLHPLRKAVTRMFGGKYSR